MAIKIRVDQYQGNDESIVSDPIIFVNGYALVERTIDIAYDLCREIGQETLPITLYPIADIPTTTQYTV